jgi:hypothetical protein
MGKPRRKRAKAKRGRPRDETVERETNGRKRRSTPKEDPRMVLLQARERMFGVRKEDAADPNAGSVLGRLHLAKAITRIMLEAGEEYRRRHRLAMKAIHADDALAVSPGGNAPRDWEAMELSDREAYADWAVRAVATYRVLKDALRAVDAYEVIERVVIEGGDMPTTALPRLTAGLNLLARKLGFVGEGAEPPVFRAGIGRSP